MTSFKNVQGRNTLKNVGNYLAIPFMKFCEQINKFCQVAKQRMDIGCSATRYEPITFPAVSVIALIAKISGDLSDCYTNLNPKFLR